MDILTSSTITSGTKRQFRAKRIKDKYNKYVPVSVNVSRIDINDPDLKNDLLEIAHEHSLNCSE